MATTPIPAVYVSATSFTVSGDRTAEFAAGVRIRADCGADGIFTGTVTASNYASGTDLTTVTVSLDSGALTSNLDGVLHGNDNLLSLCNHASLHVVGGRDALTPAAIGATTTPGPGALPLADGSGLLNAWISASASAIITSIPGHYSRDLPWAAKTVIAAADRYVLLSPNRLAVDVGGVLLWSTSQQTLDLSIAATWDSQATDYTVAANRAGKDFYVYACNNAGVLKLLVSANATYPSGFAATTSRKVGGCHCLCVAVGTISGHTLSGYLAGDILPASVWDLIHRPVSSPEGMVYVDGLGKWVDIYLASISGGKLVSAYNATYADGASATLFDWYGFSEWLARIGKRLPFQVEFMAAALGSNEGTNIAGSADPGTTGGHTDTAGRRMISSIGVEDACGVMWQWGIEAGGVAGTAGYKDQFVAGRTTQRGQGYQEPSRAILGGAWNNGAVCGSRGSAWATGPLYLASNYGARGVAEPLAA